LSEPGFEAGFFGFAGVFWIMVAVTHYYGERYCLSGGGNGGEKR
jgi:hypothetical protein